MFVQVCVRESLNVRVCNFGFKISSLVMVGFRVAAEQGLGFRVWSLLGVKEHITQGIARNRVQSAWYRVYLLFRE